MELNNNILFYPTPNDLPGIYPIVGNDGNTPPEMYKVQVGRTVIWVDGATGNPYTTGTLNLSYFEDMFLKITDGTGEKKYRSIVSAQVDLDVSWEIIEFTLGDIFEETLDGNATATATDQTWVQIVEIERVYESDVFPCKDYIDSNGTVITKGLELYAYRDEKKVTIAALDQETAVRENPPNFIRLPEHAYEDTGSGDKNKIDVDVKLFEENPDDMAAFLILPVTNLELYNQPTEADFGIPTTVKHGQAGLYGGGIKNDSLTLLSGSLDNVTDKNHITFVEYRIAITDTHTTSHLVMRFKMPEYPSNFSYDSVYIGIKAYQQKTNGTIHNVTVDIKSRKFMGSSLYEFAAVNNDPQTNAWEIDDIPDFYYQTGAPSTKNKNFYYVHYNILTDGLTSGYSTFELSGITTEEKYKNLYEMLLGFRVSTGDISQIDIQLYELAVIFKKKISIKEAIYSPFRGRIIGSDWGGRKNASVMIRDPLDVLEHFCRLQNWSEIGSAVDFGKVYSPGALINRGTGPGGFDNLVLQTVRDCRPAFQFLKKGQCWTDKAKQLLCQTFWLVNYTDVRGQESVQYIAPDTAAMTTTDDITLLDIPPDMSAGEVEEPRPEDIYCEPAIRYNYNWATGEPQDVIEITNAHNGTWQTSFTYGFEGAELAEDIYDLCHELWSMSRQVNEPPAGLSDKIMIKTYNDAIWYLETWIRWQSRKRIWVPVYYDKAKNYHIGKYVTLNLPHQTNGQTVECVVEAYEKNKNRNLCKVKLILIGDLVATIMYQDTMDASFTQWQDHMVPYASRGDGLTDKQDIM